MAFKSTIKITKISKVSCLSSQSLVSGSSLIGSDISSGVTGIIGNGAGDISEASGLASAEAGNISSVLSNIGNGAGDISKSTGFASAEADNISSIFSNIENGAGNISVGAGLTSAEAGYINPVLSNIGNGAGDIGFNSSKTSTEHVIGAASHGFIGKDSVNTCSLPGTSRSFADYSSSSTDNNFSSSNEDSFQIEINENDVPVSQKVPPRQKKASIRRKGIKSKLQKTSFQQVKSKIHEEKIDPDNPNFDVRYTVRYFLQNGALEYTCKCDNGPLNDVLKGAIDPRLLEYDDTVLQWDLIEKVWEPLFEDFNYKGESKSEKKDKLIIGDPEKEITDNLENFDFSIRPMVSKMLKLKKAFEEYLTTDHGKIKVRKK